MPDAPDQTPTLIPNSIQFDLASQISGRTYRIFVYKPSAPPPPDGYPVVTVTDGNMMFPIAATVAASFSFSERKPVIVVGVGYPADDEIKPFLLRSRDLTPPTPLEAIKPNPGMPPPKIEHYGGSENFYRFLVEELRPAIAAAYPVDAVNQTIYGHSLAGLFVLEVLFKHPESFRTYAANSPSIWWNDRSLLNHEPAFVARLQNKEIAPRILISVGAREQELPSALPPGMTREEIQTLLEEARMVDNARELAARLQQVEGAPGATTRFFIFDEEDHQTVVAGSIARALTFALRP